MRLWKKIVVFGLGGLFLTGSAYAYFDEYDDYTDSHPLRIVAYALHPVGYTLEWLALRPLHAITSQPELRPIFGYDPYGPEFRSFDYPQEAVIAPAPAPLVQPGMSAADLEALRRAAEDAQAAADEAQRAADEAKQAAEAAVRAAEKSDRAFERSLQK